LTRCRASSTSLQVGRPDAARIADIYEKQQVAEQAAPPAEKRLPDSIDIEARRVSFIILLVYTIFALALLVVWCFFRSEPQQPPVSAFPAF
jgi:predicted nucleic acid-binding Zn ribbon protein